MCLLCSEDSYNVSSISIYFLITVKLSCSLWQVPRPLHLWKRKRRKRNRGKRWRRTMTREERVYLLQGAVVDYCSRKKTIYRTFNFRSPSASSIHRVSESTGIAWIPSFIAQPLFTLYASSDLRLWGMTMKSAIVCNLPYDITSDPAKYRITEQPEDTPIWQTFILPHV